MADQDIKRAVQDIECPVFEQPAFTTPPPLEEATVALVTSASLHHPDQDELRRRHRLLRDERVAQFDRPLHEEPRVLGRD